MKTYVVRVYDTAAVYDIKTKSKEEAEEEAKKRYRKEKNSWIVPHSVEVIDEYEAERGA